MGITILGTSHIAAQSIREITRFITADKPHIVAVELDISRAAALLQDQKHALPLSMAGRIGLKGYVFAKIGQIVQQKLGKMVGIAPGSDMKTALELARKHKLEVAFIDQPIQVTLKRFSKNLTWKEKFRFVGDIFKGLFFPKKQMRELGFEQLDLRKVPAQEIITKMMNVMKKRYPNIYKTLVEERNRYMVRKLVALMRKNKGKSILAVVGAGHEEGMKELLLKVDVVG